MKTIALAISLCSIAFFAACATARPAGSPPDTDVAVVDEGGQSLPGEYELWSPIAKDSCTTGGNSCSINVPEGDYNMTFTKERVGRLATAGGGNAGGDRGVGCLRSRVHVTPGKTITCKKTQEYNCARGAVETMDCGVASSIHYGMGAQGSAPSAAPAAAAPATAPAPAAPAPVPAK